MNKVVPLRIPVESNFILEASLWLQLLNFTKKGFLYSKIFVFLLTFKSLFKVPTNYDINLTTLFI